MALALYLELQEAGKVFAAGIITPSFYDSIYMTALGKGGKKQK